MVELNTLYSNPPLFFWRLGFTGHRGQKRRFQQTRELQGVPRRLYRKDYKIKTLFWDWFRCDCSENTRFSSDIPAVRLVEMIGVFNQWNMHGLTIRLPSWILQWKVVHMWNVFRPPERFGTISIQMLMRFLGSRCQISKVSPCTETISHPTPAARAAGSFTEESDIYRKPSWNWITNR